MEFLANLIGNATAKAITPSSTPWFIYNEPECPKDLI